GAAEGEGARSPRRLQEHRIPPGGSAQPLLALRAQGPGGELAEPAPRGGSVRGAGGGGADSEAGGEGGALGADAARGDVGEGEAGASPPGIRARGIDGTAHRGRLFAG